MFNDVSGVRQTVPHSGTVDQETPVAIVPCSWNVKLTQAGRHEGGKEE